MFLKLSTVRAKQSPVLREGPQDPGLQGRMLPAPQQPNFLQQETLLGGHAMSHSACPGAALSCESSLRPAGSGRQRGHTTLGPFAREPPDRGLGPRAPKDTELGQRGLDHCCFLAQPPASGTRKVSVGHDQDGGGTDEGNG